MGKRKNKVAIAEVSLFPEGALAPIQKDADEINIVEVTSTFSEDTLMILREARNDDDLVEALGQLLDIDNGSGLAVRDTPPLFIRKLWAITGDPAIKRAAARFYMIDKLMRWKWTQDGLNPRFIDEWSQRLVDTYKHHFIRHQKTGTQYGDIVEGLKLYGEVMEAVSGKRPHGNAVFKEGTSEGELHRLANGEDDDPDKEIHWHPDKKVVGE